MTSFAAEADLKHIIIIIIDQENTGFVEDCEPKITKMTGQCAVVSMQKGEAGEYTEDDCVKACNLSPDCDFADWKSEEKTCWFGTAPNPQTVADSACDHFELLYAKTCICKYTL